MVALAGIVMDRRTAALLSLALAQTSCAMTIVRSAHLYPANDLARPYGVLEATFEARGTGHGNVTMTLTDGETAKGEFSIVRGGAVGFGNLYAQVYGDVSGSVSATTVPRTMPGGSPGMASAYGDRGTSVDCEFYNDNTSGHGMGACRTSKGALYRLRY